MLNLCPHYVDVICVVVTCLVVLHRDEAPEILSQRSAEVKTNLSRLYMYKEGGREIDNNLSGRSPAAGQCAGLSVKIKKFMDKQ